MSPLPPDHIRAAKADNPKTRARDLAQSLGISEAEICGALIGQGATRINAHPDAIIPRLTAFGPLMALTRNDSCVIEKTGVYDNYRAGPHAALVVNEPIDLRIFPAHWAYAFALEEADHESVKRSVQIFDAQGDAVHKIYLRAQSDATHWAGFVADLALPDQSATLDLSPRALPEAAKANPSRLEELRKGWDEMTDTHQFLRLVSRLKMNRLGAYRLAGRDYARRLAQGSVERLLHRAAQTSVPIMAFVGNQGMIEIHSGPIARVVEMGPWINVLDPEFDLHLRMDHIAEIYAVVKNTQRGPAHSVEFFDARGALIAQIFGVLRAAPEQVALWNALVAELEDAPVLEGIA